MIIRRRSFLIGLAAGIFAPAIVRAASLMPVKATLVWEPAIIKPHGLFHGVPRCEHCFAAWGMCAHTGGPMRKDDTDLRLDARVIANLSIDKEFKSLLRRLS